MLGFDQISVSDPDSYWIRKVPGTSISYVKKLKNVKYPNISNFATTFCISFFNWLIFLYGTGSFFLGLINNFTGTGTLKKRIRIRIHYESGSETLRAGKEICSGFF